MSSGYKALMVFFVFGIIIGLIFACLYPVIGDVTFLALSCIIWVSCLLGIGSIYLNINIKKHTEENFKFFNMCQEDKDIAQCQNKYHNNHKLHEAELLDNLKRYCRENNLDYNKSLKKYFKGYNTYIKILADRRRFASYQINNACGGLPRYCPKCRKDMIKSFNTGVPDYTGVSTQVVYSSIWEEVASVEVKTKEVTGAWTLGGATTVFTEDKKKTIRQYKCPNCGYRYTKG